MIFTNENLQLVLNYDTNGQKVFTDTERWEIHSAISYKINYPASKEISSRLSMKIAGALQRIKSTGYKVKLSRYTIDDNKQINLIIS